MRTVTEQKCVSLTLDVCVSTFFIHNSSILALVFRSIFSSLRINQERNSIWKKKENNQNHQNDNGEVYMTHSDAAAAAANPAVPQAQVRGGSGEVLQRAVGTILMTYIFLGIVSQGAEATIPVVLLIQAMMYYEVLRISQKERKDNEVPLFRLLQWYFLGIALWFSTGAALRDALVRTYPWLQPVFEYHTMGCFILCVFGFLCFVLSLKRGMYRYQFQQFTWMCMTLIFIVGQGTLQVHNMRRGMFWFLLPAGTIVNNDVWAYYCGKLFGRTPLLRLSPKKTWEGFIGSWIFTMVFAYWFAGFMSSFPAMYCAKMDFHSPLLCTRDPIFENSIRVPFVSDIVLPGFKTSEAQLHALVFGAFASLIAPFGGFFASGLKRAFKLKDFGDLIPGHGGMTDRMDCQIIMGAFTFMYIHFVVYPPTWDPTGKSDTSCPSSLEQLQKCILALPAADQAKLLMGFK